MTDPLFSQWAAECAGARFSDTANLERKRTEFERRIRRRNLVEYLAGALVIPTFVWVAWLTAQAGEVMLTLGWLLGIIGIAIVLTSLFRRAGHLPHRPELDCRTHLRAQYEQQRKALESVPRWYLAPLVPGIALVLVGSGLPIAREAGWIVALAAIAVPAGVVAALFTGIAWLNRRAARQLEHEIAALDALG